MTYYELLGVKKDADGKEIKRAYRRLAAKLHPDINKDDPQATDKFAELNLAYETLMDSEERAYYDRNGKAKSKGASKDDVDKFIVVLFEEMLAARGNAGLEDDPFGWISQNLLRKLKSERSRIPEAERAIEVQKRLKSRLIFKGEGKNPLEKIFDDKIATQLDIITNAGVAIDLIEATIPALRDFGYSKPDPSREGSLRLGSGRPQFAEDIGTPRNPRFPGDYTQDELRRIHDRGGFPR